MYHLNIYLIGTYIFHPAIRARLAIFSKTAQKVRNMYILGALLGLTLRYLFITFVSDTYEENGYRVRRKMTKRTSKVYEHRAIAEQVLGHEIPPIHEVHHINFNRQDNRLENLCILNENDHRHYHNWHRWMLKHKPEVTLCDSFLRNKLRTKFKGEILSEYNKDIEHWNRVLHEA